MTLLNEMYNTFPRQLGFPQRITVNSMTEMIHHINKNNGKLRVFASVYNYTANEDKDKQNLNLNSIFFDLDSKNCYDNIIKFHCYLMEKDIKHLILFSGAGFHVYVFTQGYEYIKNKKDTLFNVQHYLAKELNFTIGDSKKADIDEHIVGDIARIATLLGT